jgi:uncharacterized protein
MQNSRKIALITGASSGIGKELTKNFARDGYDVVLAARSVKKMEEQAAELQKRYGMTATVIAADLESDDGATKLYTDVKNRGMVLSALANNAGYGVFGEFKDLALEPQLNMMALNIKALVVLTKLFLPDLLLSKGHIINTASIAAFQPDPYMAVYGATKSFVLSFSEAIAAELENTGVSVTALCPGPTASGFVDKADMHSSALVKGKKLPTSAEVATKGYRAMKRGQRVYITGIMNRLLAQSTRFGSRSLVTKIAKAMLKPV